MKFLLTPLTMILWYFASYIGFYATFPLMVWMWSLSWFWLIVGYPFFLGLISYFATLLHLIMNSLILKLYGSNWITTLLHSLSGLAGVVVAISFFYENPPLLVSGADSVFFLKGMWNHAPIKIVVLAWPFLVILVCILYFAIIHPFVLFVLKDERF